MVPQQEEMLLLESSTATESITRAKDSVVSVVLEDSLEEEKAKAVERELFQEVLTVVLPQVQRL